MLTHFFCVKSLILDENNLKNKYGTPQVAKGILDITSKLADRAHKTDCIWIVSNIPVQLMSWPYF